MVAPTRQLILTAVLTSAFALGATEADTATGFIGYLGDGSGVWPEDCTPVTSWNEFAIDWVTPKTGRDKGKWWKAKPKRAGDKHENLVWRKDLTMSCHGGMIVAGGKLFLMRDRGGPHFSRSTEPVPFLGAELVCLDPEDGEILWRHDCNHLDQIPADKRAEVESGLREWTDWYRVYRRAYDDWRRTTVRKVFKMKEHIAKHTPTDEGRAIWRKGTAIFAEHAPGIPLDLDEVIKACKERGHKWKCLKNITHNYAGPWDAIAKKCGVAGPMEYYQRELATYGYTEGSWYGQGARCGSAFATPTSDGEHIFVQTGYMDAFCIDMEGKRVWSAWFGANQKQYGKMLASPVLVDDKVILVGGPSNLKNNQRHLGEAMVARSPYKNWIRALDKATGKQLWVADLPTASYSNVTPVPLRLPLDDGHLEVIWTTVGNVYRAEDGKLLASDLGCQGNGRGVNYDAERQIIVLDNGAAAGGHGKPKGFEKGIIAIKLKAESRDVVGAELLWHKGDSGAEAVIMGEHASIYNKEKLRVVGLLSGKELGSVGVKAKRGGQISHRMVGAGGRYLFGIDGKGNGHCVVFDVADPSAPQFCGINLLGCERTWSQGAVPTVSGNRIFIRSEQSLYCIGDPSQAMRLSEAHR